MEHTKLGELVRTSSPGCSARTSEKVRSTRKGSDPWAAAVEVAAPFSLGGDAICVLITCVDRDVVGKKWGKGGNDIVTQGGFSEVPLWEFGYGRVYKLPLLR